MAENKDYLFEEFPPVSREEWEKVIERDLKGADYRKKLKWESGEGFEVLPFYVREDIEDSPVVVSGSNNRWTPCALISDQDIGQAADTAQKTIEKGGEGLQFTFKVRSTSGMLGGDLEGTAIQDQSAFDKLFSSIDGKDVSLFFDSGIATPILLAMLRNNLENSNTEHDNLITFSYDPHVYMAGKGKLPRKEPFLQREIVEMVRWMNSPGTVKPLCADGRFWHNCGGTMVQELGLSLAAASEYMALLTDNDISADTAADSICFYLSAGSKYFPEIAKFRALRMLWKQLLDAYNLEKGVTAYIHAETSTWNKTLYDPYVNMLRTTTEGMAAAIGGVDSLTVHPFDVIFEKPTDFSERIARNSQIIMQEEAHFDKVVDPAAGSYYIQEITNKIAQKSWSLFQEIEQQGGLLESLRNGTVQSALEKTQHERNQKIAARSRTFVGTNQYPNPDEEAPGQSESAYSTVSLDETDFEFSFDAENKSVLPQIRQALNDGAALGDIVPKLFQEDWSKHNLRTIETYRGSKAFEELRLATEQNKSTPLVLTIPIGNKSMRKARSAFTANFFGCAGYEIEEPIGFKDVHEAIETVKEFQPDIVVLCSSDKEYEELVPAFCNEIAKLDEKPESVLAGYPEKHIERYREAGIDEFIHSKCNVLQTLINFQKKLGII